MSAKEQPSPINPLVTAKHAEALRHGFSAWPTLEYGMPPALGDFRWTEELILSTWYQAEHGEPPRNGLEYRVGKSGGGFDSLDFRFLPQENWLSVSYLPDLSLDLNRRSDTRKKINLPNLPIYGAGMSYGSVSEQVMISRARAAGKWRSFTSTGEGGFPEGLLDYSDSVIVQVATGLFGVREETLIRAPIIEFKYAQGAKPGLRS